MCSRRSNIIAGQNTCILIDIDAKALVHLVTADQPQVITAVILEKLLEELTRIFGIARIGRMHTMEDLLLRIFASHRGIILQALDE